MPRPTKAILSSGRWRFTASLEPVLGLAPGKGHTLKQVLVQITSLTGVEPREVQVDPGYRGHRIKDDGVEIILARRKRGITPAKRNRMRRRNAIEPIIGHLKNDRKIGPKNWLKGKLGDKINAISMAIGFNMRKILRKIFLWLLEILLSLFKTKKYQFQNGLF